MSAYLLSTQSIVDRLSGKPDYPIFDWLNEQTTANSAIYVSVVSIGFARWLVGDIADQIERQRYSRDLDRMVGGLRKGSIIPFDEQLTQAWAKLLSHPAELECYTDGRKNSPRTRVSDAELMIIATAMAKNLILVEPEQPYHADLAGNGLRVETLGE